MCVSHESKSNFFLNFYLRFIVVERWESEMFNEEMESFVQNQMQDNNGQKCGEL